MYVGLNYDLGDKYSTYHYGILWVRNVNCWSVKWVIGYKKWEQKIRAIRNSSRNPKLVHIFDKLGLIENFRTGIPRTIDAYQGSDLKPIFESSDKYFFVTLPNLNYKQPDQINDPINDLALLILRVVKGKPGLNVPSLMKYNWKCQM